MEQDNMIFLESRCKGELFDFVEKSFSKRHTIDFPDVLDALAINPQVFKHISTISEDAGCSEEVASDLLKFLHFEGIVRKLGNYWCYVDDWQKILRCVDDE